MDEIDESKVFDETKIKTEENADNQQDEEHTNESQIIRRARIIVRNLSFKTTEKKLKEHFEKYGSVWEVKLLRRPDGKLVGCGFVQFRKVQDAAKAIYHCTGKPFLGRDIVCDWALNKDTYLKNMREAKHMKIKEEKLDEAVIKEEIASTDETKETITTEVKTDPEEFESVKEVVESDQEDEEEIERNSDQETSESDFEENDELDDKPEVEKPKPKPLKSDVDEGRTVFIKNVPFQAAESDLKNCLSQYGSIIYAVICVDPVTEHSRGTAFVKFQKKEDADKCLVAGTELTLQGNVLDCHKAMTKEELENNKKDKKTINKDSRNLYLVKEGVITAGSKSAANVSTADMTKRLQLEQWKTQMLRNLHMFVSRVRLIVHNVPPTHDDKKLRELFAKYAGPKAIIKEAKIMRNMRNVDSNGVGTSKEYGFISFTEHEDALKALRTINNNPNIFTPAKRPIVAFSIENRAVLNVKQKRLVKSKTNNPMHKEYKPNETKRKTKSESEPIQKKRKLNEKTDEAPGEFVGFTARPGLEVHKMRSNYKLKVQAEKHRKNVQIEKRKQKLGRKNLRKKQEEFTKQPRQKQNKKKEHDSFLKLVNQYKKTITSNSKARTKWYDK